MDEFSFEVKPLKGMDDYRYWADRVKCYLTIFGLECHINSPSGLVAGDTRIVKVPSPEDPKVEVDQEERITEDEEREWKSRDRRALMLIQFHAGLSSDAFRDIKDCMTAFNAWRKLEEKYRPQGTLFLLETFTRMIKCADEGDDMEKHIHRILHCKHLLNDMGIRICDEIHSAILLTTLPPKGAWEAVYWDIVRTKTEKLDPQIVMQRIRETDTLIKSRRRMDEILAQSGSKAKRGRRRGGH